MNVKLTWTEMIQAAIVGVMRQVQNLREGRQDKHGAAEEDGWTLHIVGALGELGVAKGLGLYWCGRIGNLRAADVAHYQVRAAVPIWYKLILHDDDDDAHAFILVVGAAPSLHIVGWMLARDGKRKEFWSDPTGEGRPAYFMPQQKLRPMSELVALAAAP